MNTTDEKGTALIGASSTALARSGSQALARRGLHDLEVAEQKCCPESEAQFLFCLDHNCSHDQCPNIPHLDFALVPIELAVKLPRIVPHCWTGPDDVAHGFPPGCSYCSESDPAQYGKPCPRRTSNTWYEILRVPEDASENQINDAYRDLVEEDLQIQAILSDLVEEAISNFPDMWLSAAYAVLSDPEKKRRYDAELLQQHLADPEWWTHKGNSQSRHSEALERHDKALALNPLCTSAWINICTSAWINKGLCLDELGRLPAAVECYDKAITMDGLNYVPLVRKGDIVDRMGLHEEAIRCFDAALRLSEELISAWEGKGLTLDQLGRYEDAIACYDQVLKIDCPSWTEFGKASVHSYVWNLKGATFSHARRFQEAIDCYNRAINIDPKNDDAWYNKGIALMKTSRLGEAIGCYDKALELWPGHARSWHNKGCSLRDLGRMEEAIACHEKALACDPSEVLAWHSKAQALEDLGRLNDAVSSYESYLASAPVDAQHAANREHAQARLLALKSRTRSRR